MKLACVVCLVVNETSEGDLTQVNGTIVCRRHVKSTASRELWSSLMYEARFIALHGQFVGVTDGVDTSVVEELMEQERFREHAGRY